jgi:hypothetical protein
MRIGAVHWRLNIMRFLTLIITVLALGGVAYVSLEQPSHAAVFADDSRSAGAPASR